MAIFDFVRTKVIQEAPVITAGAYGALDQVGGLLTFPQVVLNQSGAAFLLGWKVFDKSQIEAALNLILFDRKPAVQADNDPVAFTDAEAETIITTVTTSTYVKIASTSSFYRSWLTAPIPLKPFNGKNIYGVLRCTGTPTFSAVDDLVVELVVGQLGAGI